MPNTRLDLTKQEQRLLAEAAPNSRILMKRIAAFLKKHGPAIFIGTPYAPTESTHLSFDQHDWDEINKWIKEYGNVKRPYTGSRVTKKELIIFVAASLDTLQESTGLGWLGRQDARRIGVIRRELSLSHMRMLRLSMAGDEHSLMVKDQIWMETQHQKMLRGLLDGFKAKRQLADRSIEDEPL